MAVTGWTDSSENDSYKHVSTKHAGDITYTVTTSCTNQRCIISTVTTKLDTGKTDTRTAANSTATKSAHDAIVTAVNGKINSGW